MKDQRFKNEPGNHYPIDPMSKRGIELRDIIHRLSLFLAYAPSITDDTSWGEPAHSDVVSDARYEFRFEMAIELLNRVVANPEGKNPMVRVIDESGEDRKITFPVPFVEAMGDADPEEIEKALQELMKSGAVMIGGGAQPLFRLERITN